MGEYACYALNYVTVPLYDTLGDDAIVHICNQTEMKVAIVSVQKVNQNLISFFVMIAIRLECCCECWIGWRRFELWL